MLGLDIGARGLELPQLSRPDFVGSLRETLLSLRSGWGWDRGRWWVAEGKGELGLAYKIKIKTFKYNFNKHRTTTKSVVDLTLYILIIFKCWRDAEQEKGKEKL